MNYQCQHCGSIFSEYDAVVMQENVGEAWGAPAPETYLTCPDCGSEELEEYYDDI